MPGANTSDIIAQYIALIRAVGVLDPSGVILGEVSHSTRAYLRARPDTVRCVVTSLTGDGKEVALPAPLRLRLRLRLRLWWGPVWLGDQREARGSSRCSVLCTGRNRLDARAAQLGYGDESKREGGGRRVGVVAGRRGEVGPRWLVLRAVERRPETRRVSAQPARHCRHGMRHAAHIPL
jgi:hypothetical protein